MTDTIAKAVERAIGTMKENLGDQLTVDDLARSAMFSKFHFSRVFLRVTGISPGRFLSAVRLEEAKHLLLTTSITVADIGHRVGYNSIGTFSSRFRSSVGISPITYRQLGGVVPVLPIKQADVDRSIAVRGHTHGPCAGTLGSVFVGAFPSRVPEGVPARYQILPAPGAYHLPHLPVGIWYLIAYAVGLIEGRRVQFIGCHGPFTAAKDTTARLVDVHLRPVDSIDPPLLLALPDLTDNGNFGFAG